MSKNKELGAARADLSSAEPITEDFAKLMRGLTKVQKRHIANGTFSGDFRMDTVFVLKRKGIFYHKITSPNGRCGPMALTPLGERVRTALAKAQGVQS